MSAERAAQMVRKVVVRLPTPLYEELVQDAEKNDRTLSQEVRFRLRKTAP